MRERGTRGALARDSRGLARARDPTVHFSGVNLLGQTGGFFVPYSAKVVVSAAFRPAQVQMHGRSTRSTPAFTRSTGVANLSWFSTETDDVRSRCRRPRR